MREFYRTPTRLAVLAILAGWLVITVPAAPVSADEPEPLMDLQRGGVDFFNEIVPSIIEIYHASGYSMGSGSGYVIDREGHAITNFHVTMENPVFEVAFFEDIEHTREYREGRWQGQLIAIDPALDLALLRIDAPPDRFHPVRLGDSSLIQPGDACVTFGSPGGEAGSFWTGEGVDRSWIALQDTWLEFYNINLGVVAEVMNFEEAFFTSRWQGQGRTDVRDYGTAVEYLFHTDSAINGGNSGGPCLNSYGEAIGTNTWGWGGENLGFSVPVNLLKRSVADMLEYGRVRRPWCGIALHPSVVAMREMIDLYERNAPPYTGAVLFDCTPDEMEIHKVNPYSPAYTAGLREGDILLRVDGQSYENIFDIYSVFLGGELGQELIIEIERDGHGMPPVRVVLEEKVTRYYGRSIQVANWGPWTYDITRYEADITY